MIEILRTTDPVQVTFVTALLREVDIEPLVFDGHMSALYGGLSMMPRRIMVIDDDAWLARKTLKAAGVEDVRE